MMTRYCDRDAEQRGLVFLKLRTDLVVERHLVAADRTPIGRVESEDDGLCPYRELDPEWLAAADRVICCGMIDGLNTEVTWSPKLPSEAPGMLRGLAVQVRGAA
jgi:hypothetical protein